MNHIEMSKMINKKSNTKKAITKIQLQKHDIMFDESYCKALLDANKVKEVQEYVKKFFFRYKKEIFVFDGEIFDLYSQLDAGKMIPNDLVIRYMVPDEATKKFRSEEFSVEKYLKSTDFMQDSYKPTIDFTKPLIFSEVRKIRGVEVKENFINMAKPFAIDRNAELVELTPYIKDALQMIDDHILKVLCSGDENSFRVNKNFFACTFAGRKLRICLYWESLERTGKGTFLNGLIKKILGESMYKTSSVENITTYTKPFEGCVLINPDELPVDGGSWRSVGDKMKSLITEPQFDSRTMHKTSYVIQNTFNIIITTNNKAINLTQTNNKRYHPNDISEDMIGNAEYFKKFTNIIDDPMVRLAYYQQMMEHYKTLSDWNEDEEGPTKSKISKMIEALPMFHKYIKENYVLRGLGLNMKTNDFFTKYEDDTKDRTSKIQIGKYLTSMGIKGIKKAGSNGQSQHYRYIISKDDLYNVFVEKKWLDSKVDFVNSISGRDCDEESDSDSDSNSDEEEEKNAYDFGIDKSDKSVKVSPVEELEHYKHLSEKLQNELNAKCEKAKEENVVEKEPRKKKTKASNSVNSIVDNIIENLGL